MLRVSSLHVLPQGDGGMTVLVSKDGLHAALWDGAVHTMDLATGASSVAFGGATMVGAGLVFASSSALEGDKPRWKDSVWKPLAVGDGWMVAIDVGGSGVWRPRRIARLEWPRTRS